MAYDAFVSITSIKGESTDAQHMGWIEVLNHELRQRQHIYKFPDSCGGTRGCRTEFFHFVFRKEIDASTPLLYLACAQGRHIDEVVLDICKPRGHKACLMRYMFQNCMIRLVSTLGTQYHTRELVWIDFGKIQWDYVQHNRVTGLPMGHIEAGWDRQTNSIM